VTPIELATAYHFQNTIIAVCFDEQSGKYATCKFCIGGWKVLKGKTSTPQKVDREDDAINNFHDWAEKRKLRRADCGCCRHGSSAGGCTQFGQLKQRGGIYIRHSSCREHEKEVKA